MTTPTTPEFFQQGQEAVRQAVDTWTRTVTSAVGQLPTWTPEFDAEAAIDRYFDLGAKVLGAQRDFAKKVVGYATTAGQEYVEPLLKGAKVSANA
jgi:hypothetical protein